jgi:uncharacterized membrane protein YdjX (TVP38/TMEM64 family)
MSASAHARLRGALVGLWLGVVVVAVYIALFQREWLGAELGSAASTSLLAAAAVYLVFGCIRGFTLLPSTTLIVVAIPFFPPGRLFVLTLIGILISAASVYWFAEALHLDELVAREHRRHVDRLTTMLQRYELPVIIGWSFFPLVPTDVIGYVCGVLRVDFGKYLLGIGIGEGVICAIYIFVGDFALRWLRFKP